MGLYYTLLSVTAVSVMAFLAPHLQRSRPVDQCAALSDDVVDRFLVMAAQPSSAIFVGIVLVGMGNGLIDVYLNVAAQRVEIRSGKPVLQWMHALLRVGRHHRRRGGRGSR